MSRNVSDVNIPKLSGSLGRSRRSMRIATVASSIATLTSSGDFGLTSSCMPNGREPNSLRKMPSGMIAKLSCELPNADPFFSLTPTTRKCSVPILTVLSSGSAGPNTLSATSHPSTATGRLASISAGLISRPRSTSKVEK